MSMQKPNPMHRNVLIYFIELASPMYSIVGELTRFVMATWYTDVSTKMFASAMNDILRWQIGSC